MPCEQWPSTETEERYLYRSSDYPTVSIADEKEIIEAMDVSKDYIIQIDDEDIHNTLVDADLQNVIELIFRH